MRLNRTELEVFSICGEKRHLGKGLDMCGMGLVV